MAPAEPRCDLRFYPEFRWEEREKFGGFFVNKGFRIGGFGGSVNLVLREGRRRRRRVG